MPDELNALVVGVPDAVASRIVAAVCATGRRCAAVAELDSGHASVANGTLGILLVAAAAPAASLAACQRLAERHGLAVVWCVPCGPLDPAQLMAALEHDCVAAVALDDPPEQWHRVLLRAEERRRRWQARCLELRRLESQVEDFRRRSQQQAERFQDMQETFFLDLSRMMTIITNIMDGIVFTDLAGTVTLLNPVAEDLLGTRSFVALGRPLASLQGRAELLAALAADLQRLEGQKEVVRTVEVHHSEQDLLYIRCRTSSVLDYRGQPAGVLSVLEDVTAEYKTDQLKNQYLSIVAHELRTPLTGIKTFATMMAKGTLGSLSDRQQRVVDSIREQSQRLEHQIDKLINLGNIESADYGQDREAFSAADFAGCLLSPFEQPARDRRIELRLECAATEEVLFADRADLRRACQALIENAVKFAPDGGHVTVSIGTMEQGGLRFAVRDDGIGIDPRYHRRIFEKFFQVEDPLTRHHGGAGLGLFVAKGVVEAHGSRIEVSSQLGQGADFSFALPTTRPANSPTVPAAAAN
jgi:PAS domain S-box-containing protein